ncbi:MAG: dihydrofolate reductase, partial [Clostridia bacterium]|nr:dihydrofolate reductase [Clostridia bacterium]
MNNRKVVLYIGISLDGYIATKDDSLEWLLSTQGNGDNGFGEFYDTVETIIMGRRTYDWIMEQENGRFPYIGKECYVYTTRAIEDKEHVRFTSQSPENLIAGLEKAGGKIWIVGGSQIIDLVRKKNLIDEYILSIAPVILGEGIPLFCKGERNDLVFDQARTFGQFLEVT